MATNTDFSLYALEDAVLTVSMAPPVSVGGWSVEFRMQKYFGETQSGSLLKSVSSGFNGASGITVVNSGQGVFAIDIKSIDSSGLDYGNYAYDVKRTDSNQKTVLSLGFGLLGPDIG